MKVKIVLEEGGIMPKKATPGSAAYDLFTPCDYVIRYGRQVLPLNFRIQMPYGIEADIEPRSGFSSKGIEGSKIELAKYFDITERFIKAEVVFGKVDPDYTGIVGVIIKNLGCEFVLKKGTRIAQMTFRRYEDADFEVTDMLDESERGDGGFGHSGTK